MKVTKITFTSTFSSVGQGRMWSTFLAGAVNKWILVIKNRALLKPFNFAKLAG